MTIICPDSKKFYYESAPADSVIAISINDLMIEGEEQAFFTNSFITVVDDDDGNSVYPNIPAGVLDRSGSITNDGTNIYYTVSPNVVPGDTITIEYLAYDTLDDDTCEQTFELVLQTPAPALPGFECVDRTFTRTGNNAIIVTGLTPEGISGFTFNEISVTDNNGNDVPSGWSIDSGGLFLRPNSNILADGVYRISYRLRETATGNISDLCTLTVNYTGSTVTVPDNGTNPNNAVGQCLSQPDIQLANGPNGLILAQNLATGGQIANVKVVNLANNNDITSSYPWSLHLGNTLRIDSVPDNSTVQITYDVVATVGGAILKSCPGFKIVKSETGAGGINGLDCNVTKWKNGTPVIRNEVSEHEIYMGKLDGSPLTLSAQQVQSALGPLVPAGVVISVVDSDGLGNYTIKIDPTAANFTGVIDASMYL